MNPTSISAHVLNKLNIPAFDKSDPLHCAISALCEEGHRETDEGKLRAIRAALDVAAATLYGIESETLLTELALSGEKYNLNDIVAITKSSENKLVWLEILIGAANTII